MVEETLRCRHSKGPPGFRRMVVLCVCVLFIIPGFSTVNPNANLSVLPTEQGFPIFPSSTADTPPSNSLEETTLKALLPIIVILLFLLLLTTVLFLRERRRRKQGMDSDVSKSKNMCTPDMPPDMSTLYAVIQKPDNADARTACMENTARNTEPVGGYEEIQPSPTVSDTTPIYAVVKKGKISRNHGIENPTMDAARSEHHYEEIWCSPMMPGSRDAACSTVPFTATDHDQQQQQEHLYSTVEFTDMAPSEEPQYYLLTK